MRRVKLYRQCRGVVDQVVKDVWYLPGGLALWQYLPSVGRGNKESIKRKWADRIYTTLFDDTLRRALLLAIIDTNFTTPDNARELYQWVLQNIYNNDERKLYKERMSIHL